MQGNARQGMCQSRKKKGFFLEKAIIHNINQARTQGGGGGGGVRWVRTTPPPFDMRCQLKKYKATTVN